MTDRRRRVTIAPETIRGRTGFYRVGQSDAGRWWVIAPDGSPMLYRGCNAALRQEVGAAGDNLYFQWVEQQYGPDHARFVADTARTLRDAGFNAWGGWSMLFTPQEGHRENGMPFVEILTPRECGKPGMLMHMKRDRKTGETQGWGHGPNIDVFNPAVWRQVEAHFRTHFAKLHENSSLLGYFCDNECMYGQPRTDAAWTGKLSDLATPPPVPTLLQQCLTQPEDRASCKAAWEWVLARHGGSVSGLARDWGLDIADHGDLQRLTHEQAVILTSDAYSEDHAGFTHLYVREYYTRMHDLIRRYDPNHLIMTTRCPAPPGPIVLEAMRECFQDGLIDVLAMNNYRDTFLDRLNEFCSDGFLPILNGEFNWCGGHFLDWGKYLREERFSEEEKAEIAVRGRMALEQAFTHSSLIGYTWFKWYSGIEFTSNEYGLADDQPFGAVVTNNGKINRFNAPLLREIHPRLEGIARGELEPFRVDGLEPVVQTVGE
jgi:hypothetical protein